MREKNGKQKRLLYVPAMMLSFMAFLFCTACGSKAGDDGLKEITLREDDGKNGENAGTGSENGTQNSTDTVQETVFVYVCGEVNVPGVYELSEGARVFEAVQSAGGATEYAAQELVNQARAVEDGERIYIPSREEAERYLSEARMSGTDPVSSGLNEEWSLPGNGEGRKININTAGKDDLMTLPGIGEAKAMSIISYRNENGDFESIEEIMQIEGIKEGVFNKIKDEITI